MRNHVLIYPSTGFANRSKQINGFTLFEVLATVGLAVLIMVIITASLFFGGRSAARTRTSIVKKQEVLKQFHDIRFQLLNLYNSNETSLLGEEGSQDKASEIYFITTSLKFSGTVGEVGYKILYDDADEPYLAYIEFPYPREIRFAYHNTSDKWFISSTIIRGLTVEYLVQNEWVKEWKKNEPPEKIRVTLWYLEDETQEELYPYTFIVTPGIKSVF